MHTIHRKVTKRNPTKEPKPNPNNRTNKNKTPRPTNLLNRTKRL